MTVIESLRQQIQNANEAYWKHNKPIMSDKKYDKLVEKLVKLSPDDPLLSLVGDDAVPGEKVAHERQMLSLAKVYSWVDVIRWAFNIARSEDELLMFSPKYDGMSVEINSSKRMITRGNGMIGTDVTHIAPYTEFVIPAELRGRRVVGEFLITETNFRKLKQLPEFAEYKTPRNAASGVLNLKADNPVLKQIPPRTFTWMFHQYHEVAVTLGQLQDVKTQAKLEQELYGWHDCPCDGIVIRLADNSYANSLGTTSHHPRGAVAWKATEEEADVVVKQIVWQVGEAHVTPVCEFEEPVELDGVVVSRVTAHGKDFVVANNICVGSTLTVIRQGGVIPKIIRVYTPKGLTYSIPDKCPDCGQPLKVEGAFVSCTNDNCSSRIACKIVRGLSILGLKGVGPALALKVIGEMYITDIMTWANEIAELKSSPELWNDKWLKRQTKFTASELATLAKLTYLMKSGVTASVLLKSVCIPEVGDMFVTAINKYAGGVISLMNISPVDRIYDVLAGKEGVNADALTNFMRWVEQHHEEFVNYMALFNILPEQAPSQDGATKGTVCFTGAGPKPRTELAAIAKQQGYAVTDNANLCTILVCADPNSTSSKMKKVRAKGGVVMSYDEFFK